MMKSSPIVSMRPVSLPIIRGRAPKTFPAFSQCVHAKARMGNRNSQSIGSIGSRAFPSPSSFHFGSRTLTIMATCAFSAWPAPTTVFFTKIGGIFDDGETGQRRHDKCHAARLAELQSRLRITIDEDLFDRRLMRPVIGDDSRRLSCSAQRPLASAAFSLERIVPLAT